MLIIGSNGFLGRTIRKMLADTGRPHMTASHSGPADLTLDLTRWEGGDLDLPGWVRHAILCGGITSVDVCARDPRGTARLNVTGTLRLVDSLRRRGVTPVFCSSDLVFAGDRGGYREEDPRFPTTEYGRQKKAVEDVLLHGSAPPALVVRMSKLYSTDRDEDPSPVGDIMRRLPGQRLLAAVDQTICPTRVEDAAAALLALIDGGAKGAFHVAAPEVLSRHDLAMRIATRLGCADDVQPCLRADLPVHEPRPRDNSLDTSKIRQMFDVCFCTLDAALDKMLMLSHAGNQKGQGHDGTGNQSPRPVSEIEAADR